MDLCGLIQIKKEKKERRLNATLRATCDRATKLTMLIQLVRIISALLHFSLIQSIIVFR